MKVLIKHKHTAAKLGHALGRMDPEDGEEIFQKQMFANVRYFLMSVIKSGDPRSPLSDSLSNAAVTERRALCRFEPNSRQTVCPHWGGRIFAAANCPFAFFYICILSCPPGSRRQHIFVRLHLELEE